MMQRNSKNHLFRRVVNKRIFVGLLLVLCCGKAWSQQDPQLSQYMFNSIYYNPAYAGLDGITTLTAVHRSQWLGYQPNFGGGGPPTTQILSAHTLFSKWHSGIGIYVSNDNLGSLNNQEFKFLYAYHLTLGRSKISFGMHAGIYSQTIDFDLYRAIDPDDPLLNAEGKQSQIRPDLAAGLFFQRDKYYIGMSLTHITSPQFDFGMNQRNTLVTQYYATAGYFHDINFDFRLQFSGLVKSDLVKTIFDLSGLVYFKNTMWGGISFRQSEAAILLLGYSFLKDKSLRLGYGLDIVIQGQTGKSPTSHEFMLTYALPVTFANVKKAIRTPRYRH